MITAHRPEGGVCEFCGSGNCTGACAVRHVAPHGTRSVFDAHAGPKGCICPPGSEATCQRWDCGRKTPSAGGTTFTRYTGYPHE